MCHWRHSARKQPKLVLGTAAGCSLLLTDLHWRSYLSTGAWCWWNGPHCWESGAWEAMCTTGARHWGSCEYCRSLMLEKMHMLQKPTEEAYQELEGKSAHLAMFLHRPLLPKFSNMSAYKNYLKSPTAFSHIGQ